MREIYRLDKLATRQTCKLGIACFIKSLISNGMKMHDTNITPDAHSYGYTEQTDEHDKILSCSRIPRRRAEDVSRGVSRILHDFLPFSRNFDTYERYMLFTTQPCNNRRNEEGGKKAPNNSDGLNVVLLTAFHNFFFLLVTGCRHRRAA